MVPLCPQLTQAKELLAEAVENVRAEAERSAKEASELAQAKEGLERELAKSTAEGVQVRAGGKRRGEGRAHGGTEGRGAQGLGGGGDHGGRGRRGAE